MAVRTKEDILESIRGVIGESSDDNTIALLEDITDTYDDLETRANGDGVNWKERYEENDREWRNKYTERFFSSEPKEPEEPEKQDPPNVDEPGPERPGIPKTGDEQLQLVLLLITVLVGAVVLLTLMVLTYRDKSRRDIRKRG